MILDDGGDATHVLVNKFPAISKHIKGIVEESTTGVHRLYQVGYCWKKYSWNYYYFFRIWNNSCLKRIHLFQLRKQNKLNAPAINAHDSVTRTMVSNYYCQKEAIIDALKVISRYMFKNNFIRKDAKIIYFKH